MRIVAIALLLFLINISAYVVNETGLFGVSVQQQDEWLDDVQDVANSDYSQADLQEESVNFGFGDFVKGLWIFVKAIAYSIFAPPLILKGFGLRSPYYIILSIPIYFIYVIGIAQFVANRSMKSMT